MATQDFPSHLNLILLLKLFYIICGGGAKCSYRGQKSQRRLWGSGSYRQYWKTQHGPGNQTHAVRKSSTCFSCTAISLALLTYGLTKGRRPPCLTHTFLLGSLGGSELLTPIINNAVVQDPLGISQEGFRTAVHLLFCILGGEAREHYDHRSLYRQKH